MDYHIRTQDVQEKSTRVVFHIPISANGTNEASVQWQDAVVMGLGGADAIESVLFDIEAAELAQLKSGELYERNEQLTFSRKGLTPAVKKAEIEARFSELETEILDNKQIVLEWMGYEGTVS